MLKDKKFWKSAGIRAIKTICQTLVATAGTYAVLQDINWLTVISTSLLAGVLSILTSISTGLPECDYVAESEVEEDD